MGAIKKPTNTSGQKSTEKATEYFRGVISELKKVQWPNRQQLLTYTGVVLVAVVIVAVLLWIVDSGLSFLMTKLLG
ncbi:preprotein translocase subunit SecE [Desulfitobacterium metallireducens]|uniref:Protein translocase subunit SecE n=1 Tax=Desulfitobacterium metallireducens DSM 15288 TaxID=871968 RepID=W0E545_9FIRM|nr:preprotein translocase subunit SecE [Desulfitobacterium metallireducens]AHF05882.1 preprotein translocase subunit SecE [Desulfitobacterium metallireducens DSM 15288]